MPNVVSGHCNINTILRKNGCWQDNPFLLPWLYGLLLSRYKVALYYFMLNRPCLLLQWHVLLIATFILSVLTGGIQIVSRKITNDPNVNHPIYRIDSQYNDEDNLLVSGYFHIKPTVTSTEYSYSAHNNEHKQEKLLPGLIGIKVSDGTESWRRPFINEPSKHNCRLLDTNSDGTQDCIVVGNHGLLSAIDPNNGKYIRNLLTTYTS